MSDDTPDQQEQWVPWHVGAEMLNLKKSSFFTLVEKKRIRPQPGTSQHKGRYSLADILMEKRIREDRLPRKPYTKRSFSPTLDWLALSDIGAMVNLNYQITQDHRLEEAEQYLTWRKTNPYLILAAFDAKNRNICLGYLWLLPMPESTIIEVLSGKPVSSVETDTRNGEYTLFAYRCVLLPERADEVLDALIAAWGDFWVSQFPTRYVHKVYAKVVTPDCDRMIQRYHLAPRYDVASDVFELDLARPALAPTIQAFQQRLSETSQIQSNGNDLSAN